MIKDMIEPKTLKGFRDFLPKEAKKRQYVIQALKEVFESYGFEPLETPALEYDEILSGKYGEEGDKLMYRFEDRGGRKVAMRYDQTVPLARVVAQYQNELPMPFKRYQIQNVWRAENPQKGRYREFLQCDADIVGLDTPLSDAEVMLAAAKSLEKLGFKKFRILFNSRNILYRIMQEANIPEEKWNTTLQTLDKIKKVSLDDLDKELSNKGLGEKTFSTILDPAIFKVTTNWKNEDPRLSETYKNAIELGIPQKNIDFMSSIVRGLDYYTGMIFEIEIEGYDIGSVCGGGRYDKLIGMFSGKDIPAVGFSFGFDRLIEAMDELKLFPDDLISTKVLVTVFNKDLLSKSIDACSLLRSKNINTELFLEENSNLEKQLKYADKKGIPYVVIIGPEESAKNLVKIKDLRSGKQKEISQEEMAEWLNS